MGVWLEKILDSIYPRLSLCVACLGEINKGFICEECLNNISFNEYLDKKHFDDFDANYVCYYSGAIKNIIYNFKVHKNFCCGEYLGNILSDYIKKSNLKFDYLTYVPRDINKIKKEGFDQSRFLTKFLSKNLNVPFIKVVSCKGKNYDQKQMGSRDRSLNVKGKFFIDSKLDKLEDKSLLIIDDVATTYSTLNEVSRVIKKSSSKTKVSVLTIAKTLI